MRTIAFLLLAATIGHAAEPTIIGDIKVPPYKLVRLSVKDSPPKSGILWRVRGVGAVDYAGPRNKKDLAFVAPPGRYEVEAAIVTIGPGGEPSLDAIEVLVTIGDAPVPVPPGPTPPAPKPPEPGKLGLAKASFDGLMKVPESVWFTQREPLAKAQRSLAGVIRAGGLAQPADILSEWRVVNNRAVTPGTWKPWGEAVTAALETLYRDGKLPTPAAWADAFDEIANGLGG